MHAIAWLDEHPGGRLALPLGAGLERGRARARFERVVGERGGVSPHPDHVHVRDAVLGALPDERLPAVLLYEELPYAWSGDPARTARRLARRCRRRAQTLQLPVDPVAKAARIALYASQLEHLAISGRRLEDPSVVPRVERYVLLV